MCAAIARAQDESGYEEPHEVGQAQYEEEPSTQTPQGAQATTPSATTQPTQPPAPSAAQPAASPPQGSTAQPPTTPSQATITLAAVPPPAAVQEAPKTLGMQERLSLDLRSTEVTDALKYLAQKGQLNIAISKNVNGRVNLYLTEVPIQDVFDLILRSNELAYDKQGDIYNVMTETEYQALYGHKFNDLRQVKTLRLKYAIPEQAFNMLDTLKSEIGRLLVDEDSGTVMIIDTPERIRKMEEALATLERGNTIRVFELKYAKAKDVEAQLKDRLDAKKLGSVRADERTNQIIVETLPERMKDIERMVADLDQKTRQVLLEAKVIKITLKDEYDLGVEWEKVFPTKVKLHSLDLKSAFPIASGLTSLGTLTIGALATDEYTLTMKALQRLGHTHLLSSPRLTVISGQEARIHIGSREAYVTTTTTTGQTTTTTAETVTFIDVGIQLLVTPIINSDGYVTMKIKPEVSSVARTLTTPSKNTIPIVDTSTAETTMMVKDGTTVAIAGLRKDERQNADAQIPFLGSIPILGAMFRQTDRQVEKTELMVLITPTVISGAETVTGEVKMEPKVFKPYIRPREFKSYREYVP